MTTVLKVLSQNGQLGSNSMCAQRTYRRAAGGNRKAEVNANMGFLQRIMHHVKAKSRLKRNPEFLQNSALHDPKPSKIEAQGGLGSQNVAKSLHRAAKRRPRAPKRCQRGAQEAPKRGQEPPKSASRIDLATSLLHDLCGKLCSTRSRSDFVAFLGLCKKQAICKKRKKP